jgi:hypothetical protein
MRLFVMGLLLMMPFLLQAQPGRKTDSLYYLLDNTGNDINNMWKIEDDGPVTYCILQCPCLHNGNMPILHYLKDDNNTSVVDKQKLSTYQLLTLPNLIVITKKTLEMRTAGVEYVFFIITPEEGRFRMHRAKLSQTKTVN